MRNEEKECPKFGHRSDKIFATDSEVVATVCLRCGEIVSMRVKNLDKFKI